MPCERIWDNLDAGNTMHPNQIFRSADNARNLEFADQHSFGTLAISSDGAPLMSHVPFLIDHDAGAVDLHLVRSNPIARALSKSPSLPARIAVTGPESYISPDWYGLPDQVPTWNYVAVHLTGDLALLPQDDLLDLLDRQSAHFEARLLPKSPWTMDKMDREARDKLLRMIVPVRLTLRDVDGTWKLNQNKPDSARLAAANQVEALASDSLATLMRSRGA